MSLDEAPHVYKKMLVTDLVEAYEDYTVLSSFFLFYAFFVFTDNLYGSYLLSFTYN